MNTLVGVATTRLPSGDVRVQTVAGCDGRVVDGPHRQVLAEHRPDVTRTSCASCGFGYSEAQPLCPTLAKTLRELASGTHRPRSSPLNQYSTAKLRSLIAEHRGEGRCRRCGFVYSPDREQMCPARRRIADVLACRNEDAAVSAPHQGQGLCAGKGTAWSVSGNDPAPWQRAMKVCSACPLLAQCDAGVRDRLADGQKIREQVVAGRLFTVEGREIKADEIDKFAIARGRKKSSSRLPATPSVPVISTPALQLSFFEGVAA